MSGTARVNNLDLLAPPVAQTIQQRSLIVGVVFALLSVIGAFAAPDKFHRAFLLGYMAWVGLTMGCAAILMLQHLTGGAWGQVIRRILEAGTRTLPLMVALFIPLVLGMKSLYVWAQPAEVAKDKHLQEITKSYLSPNAFILRALLYFAIWGVVVYLLNRWSAEQDAPRVRDTSLRFRALSGPGLVLYGLTVSFAAVDWVMSLDPQWISTIYGLIVLAGQGLSALCFVVVVEAILSRHQPMAELVRAKEVHDHGNLILAFVMLWAYMSFSQWLIIWAGNLPEEITWYLKRLQGGWQFVGLFLALFHFCVPFVLLLSRGFKRNLRRLVWLAVGLMFVRYTDLLWMIEPNFSKEFHLSWLDVVVPVAMGGFWLAYFFRNLKGRPLLPLYDPRTRAILEPAHE